MTDWRAFPEESFAGSIQILVETGPADGLAKDATAGSLEQSSSGGGG